MKTFKSILLLIVSALFIVSCSKDDVTPATTVENASLSITSNSQVVSVPSAMASSQDSTAAVAATWVASVNNISTYLNYMKPPAGAIKSSTKITAANGRVATSDDVVVYIWSDGAGGSVGYQKSETADSYVFELFLLTPDTTAWLKYFHAEEKKDKSSGFMYVLDVTSMFGDPSFKIAEYSWARSGDMLTFNANVFDLLKVTLQLNEKTKAGDIIYYIGDVKLYEVEWTSTGSGAWKEFDREGAVVRSGSWKV